MLDIVAQAGIMLFGVSAVFVVGLKDKNKARWGYVLGLCGQPFWVYVSLNPFQFGIFILVLMYTFTWANGFRNNWKATQ